MKHILHMRHFHLQCHVQSAPQPQELLVAPFYTIDEAFGAQSRLPHNVHQWRID